MFKLTNYPLQKFLNKLIEELEYENNRRIKPEEYKLNIPFIVSTLYQGFTENVDKYESFATDLYEWKYDICIEKPHDDYNGIIDVEIYLSKYTEGIPNYPDYYWRLCFLEDERYFGYCECTPDMPDYREDKHCCGHGCDAIFCGLSLQKITTIVDEKWNGDEHDYWNFEDMFFKNRNDFVKLEIEQQLNDLNLRKTDIETQINNLKEQLNLLKEG